MKLPAGIQSLGWRKKITKKEGFIETTITLKTAVPIALACCWLILSAFAFTINNTIWKVNEYPFDYYYGFHTYQFYLRYDGDDWWQWDKGFPFPFGFSLFFDCPAGMGFGFAYGEAVDMYHYQHILFNNQDNTAITWCYRRIKNPQPGENPLIRYMLTLHKISDNWDGVSPPPDR